MTFADSVLHLVRAGARIEPSEPAPEESISAPSSLPSAALTGFEFAEADGEPLAPYEPGLADLEAAVALVVTGVATRVTLAGFPSWQGLLWRAYELAADADVLILPTVIHPGGKVDIVVMRDTARGG